MFTAVSVSTTHLIMSSLKFPASIYVVPRLITNDRVLTTPQLNFIPKELSIVISAVPA